MSDAAGQDGAALDGLARELTALRARVDDLEAVQAIHRLKARYGQLADRRYAAATEERERIAEEIAALFTDDAVWDGGAKLGLCEGRAAIAARLREPTLGFAWHYFVKPQIEVAGDRATGTWDILAPCTGLDGRAWWMAGVEEDAYQRVDGRWLHSRMRLDVVFMAPYERGWGKRAPGSQDPGAT